MGKNKLKRFAEMETFSCVFQYPFAVVKEKGFPMKGKWNEMYFHNSNPIVLELGCGKGEYAVGLGKKFPDKNYIGIDIKGARMWTGAKMVEKEHIANVAFLRTSIELIDNFFAPGEVAEIWITLHLKTDSPFLYTYTHELARLNHLNTLVDTSDLYASGLADDILEIKTHYENQWLQRGLTIKYISFVLPQEGVLQEPDIDIEPDTYRSYGRGEIQMPQIFDNNNKQT